MSAQVALRDLARLAAAMVLHDEAELRRFAAAHAGEGASRELHEALLQCHLFCGFPRAIAGLEALHAAGLRLQPIDGTDPHSPERGAEVFDAIYGSGRDDVRAFLAELSPTFAEWVAEHAYGRVLSRPGLSPLRRELLAVAMLAATGHDRQLASHARGAARFGATSEQVLNVLAEIEDLVEPSRWERARDVATRFAR